MRDYTRLGEATQPSRPALQPENLLLDSVPDFWTYFRTWTVDDKPVKTKSKTMSQQQTFKGIKITTENKCGFCDGAKCCTYITEQLETPRSMHDFDHMLWQISHQDIKIYKDDDGWYLLVERSCLHLQPDGRCGIYETRPMVCREHSNDYCEFDAPAEDGFELYFPDYDSLLKYCKKRYKTWGKRFDKM